MKKPDKSSSTIQNKPDEKENKKNLLEFKLSKESYILIGISLFFIVLGYLLLMGGGEQKNGEFNYDIFNTQRLYVAPLLLIIGYVIPFFAIFYKKKE